MLVERKPHALAGAALTILEVGHLFELGLFDTSYPFEINSICNWGRLTDVASIWLKLCIAAHFLRLTLHSFRVVSFNVLVSSMGALLNLA